MSSDRYSSASPQRYGRPSYLDEEQTPQFYHLSRNSSYTNLNSYRAVDGYSMQSGGSVSTSRSVSRAPSVSRYDYSISSNSAAVESPFARSSNFPSSRPISRGGSPFGGYDQPMSRPPSRSRTPIPSYTDALCKVSRRIRQRSVPPPAPPPRHEFSVPRPSCYTSVGMKAPNPSRVVASDYYKKYIKSIYEREPMFQSFYDSIPTSQRNFYNAESMTKLKRDFNDMVSDNWSRKGMGDPTVPLDIGTKVLSWGNYAQSRAGDETASERLFRVHSRPQTLTPTLPRVRVYHRSTWRP